jgi:putative aldouronate transport system permease protein
MLYLFILPSLVAVYLFHYRPFRWIIMAFQDYDFFEGFAGSPWVGLKHFVKFVTGPDFWRIIRNTLAINGFALIIGFPLPIVFALLVNELQHRGFKRSVQTITYLPHFVSWVIVAGLAYNLLDYSTGLVNRLVEAAGLEPVAFLREARYFWPMIVSAAIWKELGWGSIIFLAALSSIDENLYEAARIDGANRWQEVWHITLPGLLPTISVVLILTAGRIITGGGLIPSFEAVFNMGNPLLFETAETVGIHVYYRGILGNNYSYATAVGVFQSIIAFIFVFGSNWLSKKLKGYGVV